MKNVAEVKRAFAALPERVTAAQIAEATGRAHIQNWVKDPAFPGGEKDHGGRTVYRDRDKVWEWYASQSFSRTDRSGPRDLETKVISAQPTQALLDTSELAELLGLTRRAVNKYPDRYPASETKDPFPPADADGKRSWSQVRAWFLRKKDPMPKAGEGGVRDWADVRGWLLKRADDVSTAVDGHVYLDELGLTIGQRDVVERARLARASETSVPVEWLAEVLHLEEPGQAQWLAELLDLMDAGHDALRPRAPATAQQSRRLGPTGLAREFGLSPETIKHYARAYTPEKTADPFPAKDNRRTRDLAEVRSWLLRNRKLRPAEPNESAADA
ncbi:hypothetical protein ACIP5N_22035 [Streptomyces sp. NPDC088768]|uniref:hypothetical protein n=1 Tax=Streptomyces sp. NPDC088768 TaxID=3365894 RepID=UPI0038121CB3